MMPDEEAEFTRLSQLEVIVADLIRRVERLEVHGESPAAPAARTHVRQWTLRLSEDLIAAIRRIARAQGQRPSHLVEHILRQWVGTYDRGEPHSQMYSYPHPLRHTGLTTPGSQLFKAPLPCQKSLLTSICESDTTRASSRAIRASHFP